MKCPDFTTLCTRKQDLEIRIWRVLLRLSVELHDLGEVQAFDATGIHRFSASQNYVKRTNTASSAGTAVISILYIMIQSIINA